MKQLRKFEQDTPEQAWKDQVRGIYDYEPECFRRFFTSPFEQYHEHVGKSFIVIRRLPDAEPAEEGSPGEDMYLIQVETGEEIQAFGHEVCLLYDDE